MRKAQKSYRLNPDGSNISCGCKDKYEGNPLAHARKIIKGMMDYGFPPHQVVRLIEDWYHRVDRKWVVTERVVGCWTVAELLELQAEVH